MMMSKNFWKRKKQWYNDPYQQYIIEIAIGIRVKYVSANLISLSWHYVKSLCHWTKQYNLMSFITKWHKSEVINMGNFIWISTLILHLYATYSYVKGKYKHTKSISISWFNAHNIVLDILNKKTSRNQQSHCE